MVVHVTVEEQGAKKSLNNPGGDELMKSVGGSSSLPHFAFLDSDGTMIVNSNEPGKGDIGHPYEPHEVDWFMTMLARGAPRMTPEEKGVIETYLRGQKK